MSEKENSSKINHYHITATTVNIVEQGMGSNHGNDAVQHISGHTDFLLLLKEIMKLRMEVKELKALNRNLLSKIEANNKPISNSNDKNDSDVLQRIIEIKWNKSQCTILKTSATKQYFEFYNYHIDHKTPIRLFLKE